MIRKAVPSDISAIVDLAVEALSVDLYEQLVISRERVKQLTVECVSSASHFAWVSEKRGRIVGAMVAFNSPMEFYERNSANVLMLFCKGGDGMKLLSQFMRWFQSKPIIKQVQITWERNGDSRIPNILKKRYGFKDDVPLLYLMR